MRGIGSGVSAWRAEVVLRVPGLESDRLQQRLLDVVAGRLQTLDAEGVEWVQDLKATWSYDIQPPEPDAGVGVACWVLADTVGEAADAVWQLVQSSMATLAVDFSLWDLRVLPRHAILSGPGYS